MSIRQTNKVKPGGLVGTERINIESRKGDNTTEWFLFDTSLQEIANLASGYTDILEIPTAENDTSLILKPNGIGGVSWETDAGGGILPGNLGNVIISDGVGGATATDSFKWDDAASILTLDADTDISISKGFTPQLGNFTNTGITSRFDINNRVLIESIGSDLVSKLDLHLVVGGVIKSINFRSDGVVIGVLKSGTSQIDAGANADELWRDTADNSIKIGV